jgi:hypothetical protein
LAASPAAGAVSVAQAAAPQQQQQTQQPVVTRTNKTSSSSISSTAQVDAAFATFVDHPSRSRQAGHARRSGPAPAVESGRQDLLLATGSARRSASKLSDFGDLTVDRPPHESGRHDAVLDAVFSSAALAFSEFSRVGLGPI